MGIGISGFSEIKTLKCKFFQICSIWGQIWVYIKDFQTRKLNRRVFTAISDFSVLNKNSDNLTRSVDFSTEIFDFWTKIFELWSV